MLMNLHLQATFHSTARQTTDRETMLQMYSDIAGIACTGNDFV